MGLEIRVRGADRLREAAALLRGAKRKYHKAISVAYSDAAQAVVWDIKGRALSMRIYGREVARARRKFTELRPGTALRARIAEAVAVEKNLDGDEMHVAFYVDEDAMGGRAGGGNIPARIEDRGSWNHPIMGMRDRWATNVGDKGWFTDATSGADDEFYAKIDDAITRVTEEIQEQL